MNKQNKARGSCLAISAVMLEVHVSRVSMQEGEPPQSIFFIPCYNTEAGPTRKVNNVAREKRLAK